MKKFLFVCLVKVDSVLGLIRDNYRGHSAWDRWDHILESANIALWPSYDGEGFAELFGRGGVA